MRQRSCIRLYRLVRIRVSVSWFRFWNEVAAHSHSRDGGYYGKTGRVSNSQCSILQAHLRLLVHHDFSASQHHSWRRQWSFHTEQRTSAYDQNSSANGRISWSIRGVNNVFEGDERIRICQTLCFILRSRQRSSLKANQSVHDKPSCFDQIWGWRPSPKCVLFLASSILLIIPITDFGVTPTASGIKRAGTLMRSPMEGRRDKEKEKGGEMRASEVNICLFLRYRLWRSILRLSRWCWKIYPHKSIEKMTS